MNPTDNIVGNPKFINTRYFREAALDFKKNKGRYTLAPIGSKEWYDYWEEQKRRCLFGYKVGGVKVTGKHYFYMNFTQLKKVEDELKGAKVAKKAPDFPSFYEIDYDWWWYKEIAWLGCDKATLDKLHLWRNPAPNEDGTYGGAKHLVCAKTRRAGFSYKEGADGVYNFNFIPASISYYFASLEDYLTKDGILNKVQFDLDFLNQHTDGYWLKNRMERYSLMHQKASYIDEDKQTKGFLSEIIGVIVNDPEKVRGKDGLKITYEEGGSFKHLKKALGVSVPSVTEGATLTGQISVFGTGGDEKGAYIEGLEEIYNNPHIFHMLPFKNDWEEGFEATECGVFIPCYMANPSFMDPDGNVNIEAAVAFEDKERDLKRLSKDSKDIDRRTAENPKTPKEAFLRITSSIFPKAQVLAQKQRIQSSRELKGLIDYGDIVNEAGKGWQFRVNPNAKPLLSYPHKDEDDIRGCITMVEQPQKCAININGRPVIKVPDGVYVIVVDPYYKEEAKGENSTISLGAIYVVKQTSIYFNNKSSQNVCWFVGRPESSNKFYDIIFGLSEMYNAPIQSEIAGGGQGIIDAARVRKKVNRLMFEPVYINATEVEKISKNRNFFVEVLGENKKINLTYYADWLTTVIGLDEDGFEILNLHYEYDIALLDEILKYNDEGNFDRVSAQLVKMVTIREKIQEASKKKKDHNKKSIFGNRALFGGGTNNPNDLMLLDNDGYVIKGTTW